LCGAYREQDAALNLLLSHEADLLGRPAIRRESPRYRRFCAARGVVSSAVYGFLGFNLAGSSARGTPAQCAEPSPWRWIISAPHAARWERHRRPPGPLSRVLWIYDDSIAVAPYDSAAAARVLDAAGWRRGADGIRARGQTLVVDILVPAPALRGVTWPRSFRDVAPCRNQASITSVDFPVFQERLRTGHFDSFVGAWLDEPSPKGLGPQWTTAGIGALTTPGTGAGVRLALPARGRIPRHPSRGQAGMA
jgi:hypothetical protein